MTEAKQPCVRLSSTADMPGPTDVPDAPGAPSHVADDSWAGLHDAFADLSDGQPGLDLGDLQNHLSWDLDDLIMNMDYAMGEGPGSRLTY